MTKKLNRVVIYREGQPIAVLESCRYVKGEIECKYNMLMDDFTDVDLKACKKLLNDYIVNNIV